MSYLLSLLIIIVTIIFITIIVIIIVIIGINDGGAWLIEESIFYKEMRFHSHSQVKSCSASDYVSTKAKKLAMLSPSGAHPSGSDGGSGRSSMLIGPDLDTRLEEIMSKYGQLLQDVFSYYSAVYSPELFFMTIGM